MHLAAADAVCHGEVKYEGRPSSRRYRLLAQPGRLGRVAVRGQSARRYTVTAAIAAPSST